MNNKIIIGVDTGNRFIKSKEGIFTAGYIESDNPISQENLLFYKNKYYNIGTKRTKYKYNKTSDMTYFYLTLAAIGMRLQNEGISQTDVMLGVGLPVSHFNLKPKFIEYFTQNNIQFSFNQGDFNVNLKAFCFPQGIAGFMLNYNKYKGIDFINLLDFGQVTLDVVKIANGSPMIDSAKSIMNYGMLNLVKRVQESIRKELGIELEEEKVEASLQGKGPLFFDNRIEDIIDRVKIEFVNEALDELNEQNFELKATMNLLMGGGASVIQSTLNLDQHNNRIGYTEILPNSQLANALGYELLVKETLQRQNQSRWRIW